MGKLRIDFMACVLAGLGCDRALGLDELTFDRPPSPSAECTSHTQCAELYPIDPHVCRDSRCRPLKNNRAVSDGGAVGDCRVVLGEANLRTGYEPFVFGVLGLIDSNVPESSVTALNYRLAIAEISNRTGIPVGGQTRMPVGVMCQSAQVTPERLDRSFDHLVNDVGVSAIIAGISDPNQLRRSFERVRASHRDVFFLSPFSSMEALTAIDDGDLLWHMLPDVVDVAPPYVPLVARVEDYVNPAPPSGPRPPIRLALVTAIDFAKTAALGAALHQTLHVNGVPVALSSSDHYRVFNVISAFTQPNALLSEVADQLSAFKPHIVVSAASTELVTKLLPPLEASWNEAEQPRPFYVMSPYQIADPQFLLGAVAEGEALGQRLRERIVGVNMAAALDSTSYDAYLRRFKTMFPDADSLEGTENFYDTLYTIAYAAAAAPITNGREPQGSDLLRGMQRLLHGRRFDVGPDQLVPAFDYLGEDPTRTIALEGTMGPPEFHETGARKGTGSVWCIDEAPSGELALHFDAVRYDPVSATLSGSLPCFDAF